MPYLSFRHVSYVSASRRILADVSFDVDRGETLVLLGESGSGKTTALRLMNRMLEPASGSIQIDGQDISQLDPIALRRRIGYVIQEFGLLPHWTVEQNAALVPKLLGWPEEKGRQRAAELLEQVGLTENGMAQRKPHQLSGGQRQRVAVARALAAEPGLLLFDEPFGALDPLTRHDMQRLFKQLLRQYNAAAVFVTHDIQEALTLGTRIAVLASGKLECLVTPQEFMLTDTPVARAFRETLPAITREGGV